MTTQGKNNKHASKPRKKARTTGVRGPGKPKAGAEVCLVEDVLLLEEPLWYCEEECCCLV